MKNIVRGVVFYLLILVFVVPALIFFFIARDSRKKQSLTEVPLPSKESIVRTFCELIDEGKISDAVSIMDISDDSAKQSWGVYLNNFSSFNIKKIEKNEIDESGNSFKVTVDLALKKYVEGPIPNYGWQNGENVRFINLVEKGKGIYKISEIATGP